MSRKAPQLRILTLEAQHLPAVLPLLVTAGGLKLRDADSPQLLERYLARNPGLSLLAQEGEQIAGLVFVGHDGRRGFLHHLLVLPQFRRRGLASQLVAEALARLGRAGIAKTHIDVLIENQEAQAFWSALGWQRRDDILRYSKIQSGSANA